MQFGNETERNRMQVNNKEARLNGKGRAAGKLPSTKAWIDGLEV